MLTSARFGPDGTVGVAPDWMIDRTRWIRIDEF
jgi:hypothetical protein